MGSSSDKLTDVITKALDAVIEEFAVEFSERTVSDLVHSTLTKVWGTDRWGFRAGYKAPYADFVQWFYSIPGIRERMNNLFAEIFTQPVVNKVRLACMKDMLSRFSLGKPDSYDSRKQLEQAFVCFSEYARIRARQDAQAIYDAAREQCLVQLEAKNSTTQVAKKSPSKRKKTCSDTQDVVQET